MVAINSGVAVGMVYSLEPSITTTTTTTATAAAATVPMLPVSAGVDVERIDRATTAGTAGEEVNDDVAAQGRRCWGIARRVLTPDELEALRATEARVGAQGKGGQRVAEECCRGCPVWVWVF